MKLCMLYLGVVSCYLMKVNTIVWHYMVHDDVAAEQTYGPVLIIGEIVLAKRDNMLYNISANLFSDIDFYDWKVDKDNQRNKKSVKK
jgi:hypothetical protein